MLALTEPELRKMSLSRSRPFAESRALFTSPNLESLYPVQSYDVAPDGRRFIMVARTEAPKHTIQIVQNWYEEFRGQERD